MVLRRSHPEKLAFDKERLLWAIKRLLHNKHKPPVQAVQDLDDADELQATTDAPTTDCTDEAKAMSEPLTEDFGKTRAVTCGERTDNVNEAQVMATGAAIDGVTDLRLDSPSTNVIGKTPELIGRQSVASGQSSTYADRVIEQRLNCVKILLDSYQGQELTCEHLVLSLSNLFGIGVCDTTACAQ